MDTKIKIMNNKNLLLAVQSYPGANDTVKRHYPYWLRAGASRIVGISTTGGGCEFPNGMESVEIGINSYINGDILSRRLLDTIGWMLTQPEEWFCIIEYDTIFIKEISNLKLGATMHLTGWHTLPDTTNPFYHNPWIMDRNTAIKLKETGERLLIEKKEMLGCPDVCMGRMVTESKVDIHEFELYTQNTIDHNIDHILEAQRLVKNSLITAIHGIKSIETFNIITQ